MAAADTGRMGAAEFCSIPGAGNELSGFIDCIGKEVWVGELKKRFDILVYNNNHQPWMIVECKAETVTLNNETLQQALRYNISVPADFLVITNGNYSFGWEKRDGQLYTISELPVWAGAKS